MTRHIFAAAMLLVLGTGAASASTITLDGFTFDQAGLADEVTFSTGNNLRVVFNKNNSGGALSDLEDAILDGNGTSGVLARGGVGVLETLTVKFTDNLAFNTFGDDLVLFETGSRSMGQFIVSINGITKDVFTTYSGGQDETENSPGFTRGVSSVGIDLTEFGIASGASISELSIALFGADNDPLLAPNARRAALSGVAALNIAPAPVPVPASLPLLLGAIGAVAFVRGRKKS